ncbi:MAG: hypothetical protein MJ252_24020 [archaeon]|nr:hypothetical protein [archaeon]
MKNLSVKNQTMINLGKWEINVNKFTQKPGKEERVFGRDLCKFRRNQVNIENNQKDFQKTLKNLIEKRIVLKKMQTAKPTANINEIYHDDQEDKENIPQGKENILKNGKPKTVLQETKCSEKPKEIIMAKHQMPKREEIIPRNPSFKPSVFNAFPKENEQRKDLNLAAEKKPVLKKGRTSLSICQNFYKNKSSLMEKENSLTEFRMKDSLCLEPIEAVKNPQNVSEYVDDILLELRSKEFDFMCDPNYMDRQEELNDRMRAILIDWIVEIFAKFRLLPETIFLTVNLIDRYLSKKKTKRGNLQLVGIAAVFIATKYEEIYPPSPEKLVYITDNAYQLKQLLQMEIEMLKTLDFNVTVPSALRYLDFIKIKFGLSDLEDSKILYLLFLNLLNGSTKMYTQFQLAITATSIICPKLKKDLLNFYGRPENYSVIENCSEEMIKYMKKSKDEINPLQGVTKAFNTEKYHYVSMMNLN